MLVHADRQLAVQAKIRRDGSFKTETQSYIVNDPRHLTRAVVIGPIALKDPGPAVSNPSQVLESEVSLWKGSWPVDATKGQRTCYW